MVLTSHLKLLCYYNKKTWIAQPRIASFQKKQVYYVVWIARALFEWIFCPWIHLCGLKDTVIGNHCHLFIGYISTDAPPQDVTSSVPITFNEEDEFEEWHKVVREAEDKV